MSTTITYTGSAEVAGTPSRPRLLVRFGMGMKHAMTGESLQNWVKGLPGRRFNPDVMAWEVWGIGRNPDNIVAAAGLEVFWPEEGPLAKYSTLAQLYEPVAKLDENQRTTLVLPRFAGFPEVQRLISNSGVWDKKRELVRMPVIDVVHGASPRPGIRWDQESIDRSYELHSRSPLLNPKLGPHAAALANAVQPGDVASHLKVIQDFLGGPVGKFGVDLFPYQVVGAYGVAAGHTLLADSPGVGKAHPMSEPILTPRGFRPMSDMKVGSQVIGSDGLPTTVVGVFPQGKLPIFKVTFSDGSYSRCTAEHLWQVTTSVGKPDVMTTQQLMEVKYLNGYSIPMVGPVHLDTGFAFETADDAYREGLSKPWDVHHVGVPADPEQRLALVHGVLEALTVVEHDNIDGGCWLANITMPADAAEHFRKLVLSLGGNASCESHAIGYVRLRVALPAGVLPFRSAERNEAWDVRDGYEASRYVQSIEPDGEEESQCIRVAADDSLYVTRDYIVTHNTFQSLAATTVLRSDGMLIICPPVVTTNWSREVVKSGYADEHEIAVFRAGRKAPTLDGKKVIVISDSLLATQRPLIFAFANWANAKGLVTVAYDEIHRAKTMGSKRADTVLDMMALMDSARPIGITGTPLLSGPHELVNLLDFTGHLGPVFGGAGPFLEKFCSQDRFGGWHPKKRALPELHRLLNQHVWMRRTKAQVLPFLPQRYINAVPLDLDAKTLSEYRKTHKSIIEKVMDWFQKFKAQEGRWPDAQEVEEFSKDNLRYAAELRKAAGMTKVPIAVEMVKDWVQSNPDEPVILWAHHVEVIQALKDAADKLGVANGVIAGGTSEKERVRLVDAFQAGEIPVLICSITAAGVGITLTRGSNAVFVESDYTPALMLQAIDRQHRIGQVKDVHAEILLALGTLDEHIQATLAKKGETLEAVLGDDSNTVAVGGEGEADLMNLKQVMAQLVKETAQSLHLTYDLAA